jgi:cytochrome c-type biogenesis protein CcmH/NrfF
MTLRTLVLFVIPLVLASIGVVTVVVTRWQKKRWVLSAEAKRSLTK